MAYRSPFSLFLLFFLGATAVSAQKSDVFGARYIVTGRVLHYPEKTPFAGVTVVARGPERLAATTKADGTFRLELLRGKYTMVARMLGYFTEETPIIVPDDNEVEFLLRENALLLQEVQVSETKAEQNVSKVEIGVAKLTIKSIKKIPAVLGEVDVMRSLQLLPGVSSVGEGATGINVRGGSIDQNLILIDEAPVYNSSHLMGLFSVFNPDALKDVTFYRGGIPAQFGGRTSSVIDVKVKEPDAEKWKIQGGVGLVASRLMAEGPIVKNKIALLTAARASFSDYLFRFAKTASLKGTKANFYDITGKLAIKPSAQNQIYITFYQGKDVFKIAGDSLARTEVNATSSVFDWQTRNLTARWNHAFSEKLFANLTGVYSRYSPTITNPDSANAFELKSGLTYKNLKLDIGYVTEKHKMDAGVSIIRYDIQPGNLQPTLASSNINPLTLQKEQGLEAAVYWNHEIEVHKKLSVMYGLRYSRFGALGPYRVNQYEPDVARDPTTVTGGLDYASGKVIQSYGGWEPRLVARLNLSPTTSLKFSFNRMYQYLQLISNTTAALPTDRWKLSDAFLKPQIGDQVSLGIFKNWQKDTYETSLEVYYKRLTNVADYRNGTNLTLLEAPETAILQGTGRSYGAEVLVRKNVGFLTGWVSYTFAQTEYLIQSPYPEDKYRNGVYFPANFNKPHTINLVFNYRISRRTSWSVNWVYSTGRPITYPMDKYFVDNVYVPNYTLRNQASIPDYHRLDIGLNVDPLPAAKRKWQSGWAFSIYNLYARQNAYSIFFRTKNDNVLQFYNKVNAYKLSVFGTLIPSVTYNFTY
ncbi:MAG: TonB-dependent receptor [Spirosomataceae bacterium]